MIHVTGQDHGPLWTCAGCGAISPADRRRVCDCATEVLCDKNSNNQAWKIDDLTMIRERFDAFSRNHLLQRIHDLEAALIKKWKREPEEPDCEYREKLAAWMIAHSFATGHGDTFDDILGELSCQVERLRCEHDDLSKKVNAKRVTTP